MFIAGTDTASKTMEWAMSEMMKNPAIMEKAQSEIRQVLKGKKKFGEADIQKLNYLKAVIKETLRLHPPAPLLLPRECREACTIEGYDIPLKTKVIVNAWAIARDPSYWDNAEAFLPERFLNSSVDYKGTSLEYIPFGAGRRVCRGISFGMAVMELTLAQLLYHFNWEFPNGTTSEDFDMTEMFGASIGRKTNLCLRAIPFTHVDEE